MGEIIQFNRKIIESETVRHDTGSLSEQETSKVEQIRDSIETALETVAQTENMPLTVAMAYLAPVKFFNSSSKRSTNFPTEDTKVLSRHFFK